jgi:hypothetical protein
VQDWARAIAKTEAAQVDACGGHRSRVRTIPANGDSGRPLTPAEVRNSPFAGQSI